MTNDRGVLSLFERLISPKAIGVALTLVVAVNVCSLFFVYLPRIANEQRPTHAGAAGEPSAAGGQPPAPGLSPAVDESQRLGLAIIALTCLVGALMARTLLMRRRAGWEAGGDYVVAHSASYAGFDGSAEGPGEVSDPDARAGPRPTTSVAEIGPEAQSGETAAPAKAKLARVARVDAVRAARRRSLRRGRRPRKVFSRRSEEYLKSLQVPVRSDITRVAGLVVALEDKVDRLEEAFEEFEYGYAKPATAEEVGELEKRLDRVEGKLDRLLAVLDNRSGQNGSPDATDAARRKAREPRRLRMRALRGVPRSAGLAVGHQVLDEARVAIQLRSRAQRAREA